MHWKVKALLQKILSITKFGNNINHLSASLKPDFHKNVATYQTFECIRKFNLVKNDIKERNVALEIGTGYSLISAFVLYLIGFKTIITVDITKDAGFTALKKQLNFLTLPKNFNTILSASIHTKDQINFKIQNAITTKTLKEFLEIHNIKYIAPYTLGALEKSFPSINYLCSQVVLEHVKPKNLDMLFAFTKQCLKHNYFAVHTINFIDHFANPGIFGDKSISEFNFLKHSEKKWKFWAGNSIAYTNRLCYLYYLELAKKHELCTVNFEGENYRVQIPLNSKDINLDILKKYNQNVNVEDLTKYQRGTLILKNE